MLHDGETWYAKGWSLTVSNFAYDTFGSGDGKGIHFVFLNLTGRKVLFQGSAKMKLLSDANDKYIPCVPVSAYRGYSSNATFPDIQQGNIVVGAKLEWTWPFMFYPDPDGWCIDQLPAPQARKLTLIVDAIGDVIKNARWETDIPRP